MNFTMQEQRQVKLGTKPGIILLGACNCHKKMSVCLWACLKKNFDCNYLWPSYKKQTWNEI